MTPTARAMSPELTPARPDETSGAASARTGRLPGAEVRLSELRRGDGGRISRLDSAEPGHVRKLLALGLLPGSEVELQERGPAFVFRLGWSTFAVDAALARAVWIRPAD